MERWTERTRLLLGDEKLGRLRSAHVLVVGLGGVGAYAAEMIVRAGAGRLTIADADRVAETNINRQLEEVGYKNLGVNERPNLVVLRQSNIPAVLVEVGFINNDQDNALLDQKFDETARAIADGIAGTLWTW